MNRVLVTGGAGFIGSHLVEALLERELSVAVLDDFSTGKRENLPSARSLDLLQGSITDAAAVEEALQGCDAFVHLAAVASVERSVREPLVTHAINLGGSLQLFAEAARQGVRRGVYASSSAVYGGLTELPLSESSGVDPLSPYAVDKLAGEQYLAHFHRSGLLNATALRFFNVYGPRQDPFSPYSGVISIFLTRALAGEPLTVHGDGLQTRDFVYVKDVVAAIMAALLSSAEERELPVFNVGRGEQVSLLDLLDAIGELPGVRSPLAVTHGPARAGDVRHSLADARQLRRALGWEPRTPLAEGLAATARSLPHHA